MRRLEALGASRTDVGQDSEAAEKARKSMFVRESVMVGGRALTLETGRTLNYLSSGDENRKLSSLYLGILNRMGVKSDRFGDATAALEKL